MGLILPTDSAGKTQQGLCDGLGWKNRHGKEKLTAPSLSSVIEAVHSHKVLGREMEGQNISVDKEGRCSHLIQCVRLVWTL